MEIEVDEFTLQSVLDYLLSSLSSLLVPSLLILESPHPVPTDAATTPLREVELQRQHCASQEADRGDRVRDEADQREGARCAGLSRSQPRVKVKPSSLAVGFGRGSECAWSSSSIISMARQTSSRNTPPTFSRAVGCSPCSST